MHKLMKRRTFLQVFAQSAVILVAIGFPAIRLHAQSPYFTAWPSGADPAVVRKRLAEHLVVSGHQGPVANYPEVCAWHGALLTAKATGDKQCSGN